jgi:hypothetical protein
MYCLLSILFLWLATLTASSEAQSGSGSTTRNPATGLPPTPNPTATDILTPSPMNPGEIDTLYSNYPFLALFEPAALAVCVAPFYATCEPQMRANYSNLMDAWDEASVACYDLYCDCLPGGNIVQTFSGGTCSYYRPTSMLGVCTMYENCLPVYDQCFSNFVFSSQSLPRGCDNFLACASTPVVRAAELASCITYRRSQTPYCNHTKTCSYYIGPIDIEANIRRAENTYVVNGIPTSASSGVNGNTMSMSLIISICIVLGALLSIVIYAFAKHRAATRRWRVEQEARLIPSEELQRVVVKEVKWYGDELDGDVQLSPGTTQARGQNPVAPTCLYCHAARPQHLLLPCRCAWCGCDPKVSSRLGGSPTPIQIASTIGSPTSSPKKSDSSNAPKRCLCGKAIEHSADISAFLPTPDEATTEERKEGAESGVDATAAGDAVRRRLCVEEHSADNSSDGFSSLCVVCLDAPASIVFYPCAHRATCGPCGKRITSGDALAPSTQVRGFIRGRKIESMCPLCRSGIDFALVLPAAGSGAAKEATPPAIPPPPPPRPTPAKSRELPKVAPAPPQPRPRKDSLMDLLTEEVEPQPLPESTADQFTPAELQQLTTENQERSSPPTAHVKVEFDEDGL